MAYTKDYSSGYKYCMNRSVGFFRKLGITHEFNFAPLFEPRHIKYFINLYKAVLNFYSKEQLLFFESNIQGIIDYFKQIYSIQTSKHVSNKIQSPVPEKLVSFGQDWHWWSDSLRIDGCDIVPDIVGISTSGNCVQIFNEDKISKFDMYINMFYHDFSSHGFHFPYLKALLDDLNYIITIKGIFNNKHLFTNTKAKFISPIYPDL